MIRIGIAGMGYGAEVHLPAFLRHPGVEVAALADNGSGRAAKLCNQFGLNARTFSRGDSLVQWAGIDAVSLAVPAIHQAALVSKALASDKHVLCEKPFGSSLEDIAGFSDIAAAKRLITAIGYEFRYDSALGIMIDMIRAGEIGSISRINVTWMVGSGLNPVRQWSWRHDVALAGGVLVDWCCHVIDYAHAMVGHPVSELWCSTGIHVADRPDGHGGMKEVTAPDSCDLQCYFANGVIGRFVVSNVEAAGTGHCIEVFGTKGRLRFQHMPPFSPATKHLILQRVGETETQISVASASDHSDDRIGGFERLAGDFVKAIDGESRPVRLPTFANGEAVWRVLSAAKRSASERRVVRVVN